MTAGFLCQQMPAVLQVQPCDVNQQATAQVMREPVIQNVPQSSQQPPVIYRTLFASSNLDPVRRHPPAGSQWSSVNLHGRPHSAFLTSASRFRQPPGRLRISGFQPPQPETRNPRASRVIDTGATPAGCVARMTKLCKCEWTKPRTGWIRAAAGGTHEFSGPRWSGCRNAAVMRQQVRTRSDAVGLL
ncbi:hypothetical protein VTI74DRAFT_268 [Chaetomium olivicolor]